MKSLMLLLAILPLACLAQEQEAPLPPAVTSALDAYDVAVLRAQEKYREEIEDAKMKAVRILERWQETVTKKGDLEGALAIKTKLEKLTAHQPGGLAEVDVLGNKIPALRAEQIRREATQQLLGNWKGISGISGLHRNFHFAKTGVVTWERGFHHWVVTDEAVIIYDDDQNKPIWKFALPLQTNNWRAQHDSGTIWPFTKLD